MSSNLPQGDTLQSFETTDWSSNDSVGARDNDVELPTTSFEEPLSSFDETAAASDSASTDANDSETQADSSPGQANAANDIEEIYVTAENGKRQKIVVNYADKESIKRAHQQAAGFRKFQAERDNLKKEYEALKGELESIKPHWSKLDETFQRQGPAAVLDLLMGQSNALDALVQQKLERENLRAKNADEAYRLDQLEKQAAERREREWQDAQHKKLLEGYEAKLQRAEEKETYALLTPAFMKHSVDGKLGDPIAESRINNAIWTQTLEALESLPEEAITPETVDREFRKVAASFTRGLQVAGKKVIKQQVTEQKKAVAQKVAARAANGMQQVNSESDLRKQLWSSGSSASVLARLLGGGKK